MNSEIKTASCTQKNARNMKICFGLVIFALCILYLGLFVWAQHFLMEYRTTWYITRSALITVSCIFVIWQKIETGRIHVRCTVYAVSRRTSIWRIRGS